MRIPNFKDMEITKFLTEWSREIDKNKRESLSAIGANKSLLLYSPSGDKVYEVTVTEAGVLQATKVSG